MLLRRLKYPNTTGLILRRTLGELERTHLLKLFEEYPETRPWYREQKKQLLFPNGSVLFFGSAQNEKDMSDFYSAEFADIMPDEAQEFTQTELEKLSGSNRCTSNKQIVPKMVYTFMPSVSETGMPPVGLPYLKRVFKEHDLKPEESKRKWAFIQAFGWDNIEWARPALEQDGLSEEDFYSWDDALRREYFVQRTEYGQTLASISNVALRDAWLHGKWDVFQGQYYPKNPRTMPASEAKDRIKPWFIKWVSMDWGFDHPFCVHWHAMDENKRVITYREWQGRELSEVEIGKGIGERSQGEKLRSFPISWDAGKQSPRSMRDLPKSIMQLITDALPHDFPRPFPADSSPGTRVSRARLLAQLIESDMWQVVDRDDINSGWGCPKLLECLPSLVRDPKNTEDVYKVDFQENQIGDDSYDSVGMGLQYMVGSSQKPESVQIAEQARDIEDPVARALFIHKKTFEKRSSTVIPSRTVPSWMARVR